jgi:hypothetical protein
MSNMVHCYITTVGIIGSLIIIVYLAHKNIWVLFNLTNSSKKLKFSVACLPKL